MNFSAEEEKILEFWNSIDAFKTSNRLAKHRPVYTFYDGPPFATGLPHYGHFLAGTVKDTVTRWAMQTGFQVNRRFGWDCHGLPVEHEVDKMLGVQSPREIEEKYGIAEYNRICEETAMKYASVWKDQITRMGRWIEFENDYKTLYPWYMESVWWVFKELFSKGLVYKGVKVMPYSTGCATPLSNFEANQNYKQVQDPSVLVAFPLKTVNASLVAWTTTPWTLPANLALCVHPKKIYCLVTHKQTNHKYIILQSRIGYLSNDSSSKEAEDDYIIEERFVGEVLKGLEYVPPFSYYVEKVPTGFRVLLNDYVTDDVGTGVVHQAPYFGEDDYRICLANDVIRKDQGLLACPLDASGKFCKPILEYEGMYVKLADKQIMKDLETKGILVRRSQTSHSYPYCWRSETPLIYRAVPSWFIKVEPLVGIMCELNLHSKWVPENIQEGRFGNWLRDARDWCVSRNRFWGNPIPLWVSEDLEEIVCIGSLEELKNLSNASPEDLHRHTIDKITIPSRRSGYPPLKRTTEVFDCWFESGSMPFAQCHYPFGKMPLEFPADFVAEGVDQTRGWFYTLIVISSALFRKCPFKNVIVNGLILAADGEKMSKRLRNYPDPMEVVNKYGADALRLYLISSPAVKAECLKFREDGVRELQRDVFLPWTNALRFLSLNIDRLEKEESLKFYYDKNCIDSTNVLDKWLLSFLNSQIRFIREEMSNYRLYTVCPCLLQFIEILTNWYIRFNRPCLRGETCIEECTTSLSVLYHVLMSLAHLMAPFTPFLAEYFYQKLKPFDRTLWLESDQSVHFRQIPHCNTDVIDRSIENSVNLMRSVIETVRTLRDRHKLPTKQALPELIVICTDSACLEAILKLKSFIISELNVRKCTLTIDKTLHNVVIQITPDFKKLGTRARNSMKILSTKIKEMNDTDYLNLTEKKSFVFKEVPDFVLYPEDVSVSYKIASSQQSHLIADCSADKMFICILNTELSDDLKHEKVVKEVCNRIQRMRKAAHLVPTDPVQISLSIEPDDSALFSITRKNLEFITSLVKRPVGFETENVKNRTKILEDSFEIEDAKLTILIEKSEENLNGVASELIITQSNTSEKPFVNIILMCCAIARRRYGQPINKGTILIQSNKHKLDNLCDLNNAIGRLFAIDNCNFELYSDQGMSNRITQDTLGNLHGTTVFVIESKCPHTNKCKDVDCSSLPFAKYINVCVDSHMYPLFVENPVGCRIESINELNERISVVCDLEEFQLYSDKLHSKHLTFTDINWVDTIFVSC